MENVTRDSMTGPLDFKTLFESFPQPVLVVDRELRCVAVNDAYLRLSSGPREGVQGRPLLEFLARDLEDPQHAQARVLRDSIERVFQRREPDTVVLRALPVRPSLGGARERLWNCTSGPLLNERGEVAWVMNTWTELTPPRVAQPETGVLQRAQAVLETNQNLETELRSLKSLFEQATGFVAFLRGPEHVFELANEAFYELVGRRNLIGLTARQVFSEAEGQEYTELLERVFTTGKAFFGHGMRAFLRRSTSGVPEERFIDQVYQPIFESEDTVAGVLIQGQDITAQKRLEAEREALLQRERAARTEAEQANRLKDDFLATVSHELRTPLTAMLGWVHMLRTGSLPADKQQRALETVERNARAQSQLIEDLLDVSRIMSGKLRLEVELVDVAAVVEAALEAVRPSAEAKGLRLQPALDSFAHVMGDATRLQQVVWNLLSNAVKFTPRGGRIQVVVERRGSAVEVSVADTGRGISADFLPHVFERFRKAEGGSTQQDGGLGLGLAIVKHLVEAHGGTVAVASEGEGRGATFLLRLPMAVARRTEVDFAPLRASRGAPLQELTCPPQIDGLRLLVVDDEPDTRELLRALLERCGAKVETAASVEEGLEVFRRVRPDILISDIGMPVEDGFSLIRKVRALPAQEGGNTAAVALTAYSRSEDRTRVLLAGFKAHVPKPIEPTELMAVLASLVPPPERGA